MPIETTYVPVDNRYAALGAIAYLAVLAYPGQDEMSKRAEFVDAAKAWLSKIYIAQGGERPSIPQRLRRFPNRRIDGVIGRALRRIRARRLPAALMAREILVSAIGQDMTKRASPGRGVNAAARKMVRQLQIFIPMHKDARKEDHTNFDLDTYATKIKGRVWAETKPVLHLALALLETLEERFLTESRPIETLRVINEADWVAPTLRKAESFRSMLIRIPRMNVPEEATIRLLPESS